MPLQSIFIALSPALFEMLTLRTRTWRRASCILVGGGALAGLLGAALRDQPRGGAPRDRSPGAIAVVVAGVFQELIQLMLQNTKDRSATSATSSTPGKG